MINLMKALCLVTLLKHNCLEKGMYTTSLTSDGKKRAGILQEINLKSFLSIHQIFATLGSKASL